MKSTLYIVVCFFFLISCSNHSDPNSESLTPNNTEYTDINISTYNLKWFGIGGTMWNRPEQEFRNENLSHFIKQELKSSDVITFTEVVDTDSLKNILAGFMDCITYKGRWSRHQHVVTCFNPKKYRAEKYDSDYVIQDVDLGSGGLRPALQSKICHINGDCFLQVIGLHLIAGKKTKARIKQMEKLRDNLLTHSHRLPTVVLGDFNSYSKERNDFSKHDIDLFLDILNESDYQFTSSTKGTPTYGSGKFGRDYDQILVSKNIKVSKTQAYLACTENPPLDKQFIPYGSYRKYFSDHCPITASIRIPKNI